MTGDFIPVRAHVKTEQAVFERFNAQWTPTILVLDKDGVEQHRIEGFLPVDDFVAQLKLGLGHAARARGDWQGAEDTYRALAQSSKGDEVGAEATYWAGVSQYKASGDADALAQTAAALSRSYGSSTWAKKSSVWAS